MGRPQTGAPDDLAFPVILHSRIMSKTPFPTPLVLALWDQSGNHCAALTLLTLADPFIDRPEWILPYLSENGIDFERLLEHEYDSIEECALVDTAGSLYGADLETYNLGVPLARVVRALSPQNRLVLNYAMELAAA